MADVRDLFLGTAGTALDALADPAVAAAWDEPSALPGLTVGALVAHEARAVSTVRRYLDAGDAPVTATLVDAVGYVLAVLPDRGGDSDVDVGVARRARAAADAGPTEVLAAALDDLHVLRGSLPGVPAHRTLSVRDGVAMLLDDYLESRIVELVVHHDDLDASLPLVTRRALPEDAGSLTVRVLAELARRRSSTRTMITALARQERHDGPCPAAF